MESFLDLNILGDKKSLVLTGFKFNWNFKSNACKTISFVFGSKMLRFFFRELLKLNELFVSIVLNGIVSFSAFITSFGFKYETA